MEGNICNKLQVESVQCACLKHLDRDDIVPGSEIICTVNSIEINTFSKLSDWRNKHVIALSFYTGTGKYVPVYSSIWDRNAQSNVQEMT